MYNNNKALQFIYAEVTMKIGNLNFKTPPLMLAPMAGFTDYSFRKICESMGADITFTEMVSAKALYYKDKKTRQLLYRENKKAPLFAQLFGSEPDILAYGAKLIEDLGFEGVDLNAGCPVPKIVSNNEGSALMKNPALLGKCIEAMSSAVKIPVSVKIRAGWDASFQNAPECARICEESGAQMITVHGRTREMYYSGSADYDIIRKTAENVNIPVIANGDIKDRASFDNALLKTGAKGAMIGRGALGNPFVFNIIKGKICPPSKKEIIDTALLHLELLSANKGEYIGVREARKHIAYYIKGMEKSAKIKDIINHCEKADEMANILLAFADI